jgi:hypothetical protein
MAVPELLKAYSVALISLLAGAAVVHNLYKPDLVRRVAGRAVEAVVLLSAVCCLI